MIELGDAFIAFPGGTGSWKRLSTRERQEEIYFADNLDSIKQILLENID